MKGNHTRILLHSVESSSPLGGLYWHSCERVSLQYIVLYKQILNITAIRNLITVCGLQTIIKTNKFKKFMIKRNSSSDLNLRIMYFTMSESPTHQNEIRNSI